MKKDFVVNISKLTAAIKQRGFGLILVLDTSKDHPYTLYNDIQGVADDYAVTDDAYKIASRIFGQNPAPQQVAIFGKEYDSEIGEPADLVTALNELVNVNNDWFALTCTENANAEVIALSGWIDTQEKMYFTTTQDLSLPAQIESEQTTVMFHHSPEAYVAEGLAAYMLVRMIGGVTAKFRSISGVLASEITATELAQLHDDNGFSYIRKMGVLQTTEGKTTSGEYIDVVLGAFFLQFKMEEESALLAVNTEKIAYDNVGIASLVSVAEKVLKLGVTQGIILRDDDDNGVFQINYVKREDTPTNDIANRVYNGVSWSADLAGAIHEGTISGVLKY
ncbi:hypothetical protein Amet_4355 [Alkaliphilus metalliredigens QYMF]|uniref:DUF3383 domain-containing protein n=1 Tax=Alkaliphilus metalliredigens (strain QYMF) TaxID=293826 RepID=A6TKD6_ALKMQ|nr:DUF3383 family protein [Alkaliphilus metalliredigens]ABR46654.1 hypothetical protein Amet_0426 [Alkaliphilus metalliredigens QYMF]ABR48126.1 hypothetical protein Amet_1963 [Alkaliphilus metalliredigens QYMF]ABR50429.1 hypothetical protein Amet_4355 [Alkaliphilus metalliredigens QYMF]